MPTTPFSIIKKQNNPLGIRCPVGTPAQRIDLETLWRLIISSPRIDPPATNDREQISKWKETAFDLLLDVKGRFSGRNQPEAKLDAEDFFLIDIDHLPPAAIDGIKREIAALPFCCFAARSCTDGVWALMRGKVEKREHFDFFCRFFVCGALARVLGEPETIQAADKLAALVDPATFKPNQARYLQFDPGAIKGPAFDSPFASFDIDSSSAIDAELIDSPLYKFALHFARPLTKAQGPEIVSGSPSMACAMAAVAVCAPAEIEVAPGEKIKTNASFVCAGDSGIGKSWSKGLLEDALLDIPLNVEINTSRTVQDLFANLTETHTEKQDGEFVEKTEVPAYLYSIEEAGAKRSDDKKAGMGVASFDAVIREGIDGRIRPQSAAHSRNQICRKPMTFYGAFLSVGTVESVAKAMTGDDFTDGRERRTLYFVEKALPKDKIAFSACFAPANRSASLLAIETELRRFTSAGGGGISSWRQVVFAPLPSALLSALNFFYGTEANDGKTKHLTAKIAAYNALLDGRNQIELKDLRIAWRIFQRQSDAKGKIEENQGFETKSEAIKWTRTLEAQIKDAGGAVPYQNLKKWKILKACKLNEKSGGKITIHELWKLKIIQPIPEDQNKIEKEMRWQIFNDETPIECPEAINEKPGTQSFSAPPAPASIEKRMDALINKEIETAAQRIKSAPEGTRHDTFLNACASLEADLRAAEVDPEAAFRGLAGETNLPAHEVEGIIRHTTRNAPQMQISKAMENILADKRKAQK